MTFNQLAGTLDSQTSYIVLSGGGNLTGGVSTNLVGFVSLNGGAFNINGTWTSTNVQLAGATLSGNNVIHGGLNWIIGDWNNSAYLKRKRKFTSRFCDRGRWPLQRSVHRAWVSSRAP